MTSERFVSALHHNSAHFVTTMHGYISAKGIHIHQGYIYLLHDLLFGKDYEFNFSYADIPMSSHIHNNYVKCKVCYAIEDLFQMCLTIM